MDQINQLLVKNQLNNFDGSQKGIAVLNQFLVRNELKTFDESQKDITVLQEIDTSTNLSRKEADTIINDTCVSKISHSSIWTFGIFHFSASNVSILQVMIKIFICTLS